MKVEEEVVEGVSLGSSLYILSSAGTGVSQSVSKRF